TSVVRFYECGLGERKPVDELLRIELRLEVPPDQLEQHDQRLGRPIRATWRVAELLKQIANGGRLDGHLDRIAEARAAPTEVFEILQIVVAIADALIELGRVGMES